MLHNLLIKYLLVGKLCFLIFVLFILLVVTYVHQEYSLFPQIANIDIVDNEARNKILNQFTKYRWLLFFIPPLIVLIRIFSVSISLFVGGVVWKHEKKIKYSMFVNISQKADLIFIISAMLYSILLILYDNKIAEDTFRYTSALCFFDLDIIDSWLIIPIGVINVFELIYFLFLSKLLSISLNESYYNSMNFVISTYGFGLILYILFMIFIVLYVY